MASITSLPIEILDGILSGTTAGEPWRLYQLGHVCGDWRAIIQTSPRFWANVIANTWYYPDSSQVYDTDLLSMYHDAVRRSAPYLLSASLKLSKDHDSPTRAGRPDLMTALEPSRPRLSSLSILLDGWPTDSFYDFLRSSLSVLEELAILGAISLNSGHHEIPWSQLNRHCAPTELPRLQMLRVSGNFLGTWLAAPSLAHLHIIGTNPARRVCSWGLFLQVLERCPLRTLEIVDALPMNVKPYEDELLRRWPKARTLQALKSCTVQDTANSVITFSMFLDAAPLPPDTRLEIAFTTFNSSPTGELFSDTLFSLTFCRGRSHVARRVEIDKSLRVYVGDKKQTEIKLVPEIANAPLVAQPFGPQFFFMPFNCTENRPTVDLEVTELLLVFGHELTVQKGWWDAVLGRMPYLLRLNLGFLNPPAPLRPGQQPLSYEQYLITGILLDYLSTRKATEETGSLSLLEELHIEGLCLHGDAEARNLRDWVVSMLTMRVRHGCPPLKLLKLDCIGTTPSSLELLPAQLIYGIVDHVIVNS
ncbi:hypothetical protein L227DRAFT_610498 [Lentinus tigrinus ALCF2SS1-6]|uniref:F-box domain-containing protein n=1 Tax=Lentinus tigrinus ALCF2SS1-6 TaxID=1328759 RepID=A0A5C2SEC5_9APHY|nr:hypothetical protein L227DRAFT_610498 [Lentinus tigrinus ALCF2SS1-6]